MTHTPSAEMLALAEAIKSYRDMYKGDAVYSGPHVANILQHWADRLAASSPDYAAWMRDMRERAARNLEDLADALEKGNAPYNKPQIEALRERAGAIRALPVPDGRPRWRHKKRGTTYTEIGRAKGQCAHTDGTYSVVEDAEFVVYRADNDGALWVREVEEFADGRFERLPDGREEIQGVELHKLMTREEYDALKLIGWHQVCHNFRDETGATAIRYMSSGGRRVSTAHNYGEGQPNGNAAVSPPSEANAMGDEPMTLTIIEPSTREGGSILVADADYNDIAEFYHNEHATVPQSYETALLLAQMLVSAANSAGQDTTIPGSEDMNARFVWLEAKAIDMGYMLVPEPQHPDSPYAATPSLDREKIARALWMHFCPGLEASDQDKRFYLAAADEVALSLTTGADQNG